MGAAFPINSGGREKPFRIVNNPVETKKKGPSKEEVLQSLDTHRDIQKEWSFLTEKSETFFDHIDSLYQERYAKNLPQPDQKLATITVVPVYAELANNNFWRLLRSLAIQKETETAHEVLYVVNNSVDQAQNKDPVYIENQNTLALLRAYQGALEKIGRQEPHPVVTDQLISSLPKEITITEWEREVLASALRKEVRVYGIDASSEDAAVETGVFNPRGRARDIGGHIAYERLKKVGSLTNGKIDFIDADCHPAPSYYSDIESTRAEGNILYKRLMTHTPEIPLEEIPSKSIYPQLAYLNTYIQNALLGGRMNYLSELTHDYSRGVFPPNRTTTTEFTQRRGHGPALAVSPKVFRKVGGYPHWTPDASVAETYKKPFLKVRDDLRDNPNINQDLIARNNSREGLPMEDYDFFRNLRNQKIKRGTVSTSATVYVSSRIREGSIDGSILKKDIGSNSIRTREQLEKSIATVPERLSSLLQVLLIENIKLEKDPLFRDKRAIAFRRERLQRLFFRRKIKDLLPKIFEGPKTQWHVTLPVRDKDFFESNPEIVSILDRTIKAVKKERMGKPLNESVFDFLEKNIPDLFALPPEEEPDYEAVLAQMKSTEKTLAPYTIRDFIHIPLAMVEYDTTKDGGGVRREIRR